MRRHKLINGYKVFLSDQEEKEMDLRIANAEKEQTKKTRLEELEKNLRASPELLDAMCAHLLASSQDSPPPSPSVREKIESYRRSYGAYSSSED